jgi:double-stranded uracil-DNA glycosylase
MHTSFPPIVDRDTRIMIFGSFPGAESLRLQQYYAHPQNAFWRIVGECIGVDLVSLSYAQRVRALKAHHIGVWDVYAACERKGSLDSAIRCAEQNDFTLLKKKAPQLQRVCFNGKTAGKHASLLTALGYETVVLPSTSPANQTIPYKDKVKQWCAALQMQ